MIVKERYNIMLNPRLVEIIDREAAKAEQSRSAWINDILSQYVSEAGLLFSGSYSNNVIGQVEMGDYFD